jgi:tetratricopeptide (TPR) repeat protein
MLPRIFLLVTLLFNTISFSLTYEDIKNAYQKSYLYEKIGDYADAVKALMPVYKAYPNGYTVNLRLGWLFYLLKKYDNSEFHYRKAIKAIPSSVEAKLGLTLPLMAQQKWQETERVIYQILKTDYYNYYGNLKLCYVLEQEKKYPLMQTVALKMLAIYPTSVPFLVYLAKSYYYLGNKEKAVKLFKDVLILDPENVTAKEFLQKVEKKKKISST